MSGSAPALTSARPAGTAVYYTFGRGAAPDRTRIRDRNAATAASAMSPGPRRAAPMSAPGGQFGLVAAA